MLNGGGGKADGTRVMHEGSRREYRKSYMDEEGETRVEEGRSTKNVGRD